MSWPDVAATREEKTSWPELVGKSLEEVREVILKDMPEADTVVLPACSVVFADWRSNRLEFFHFWSNNYFVINYYSGQAFPRESVI
ncbi:Subtilisin-chymotrypsin inhibitor-2A [Triticum urartu]|uniref:Subtilisin-chymotrypsin inhibitor-2A n=1 Tax=Triticum urartu TaxID=4572 RepID=M7Y4D9_TRIUA|nr:Subtilisin-chymotrypsin inhibitor-2A [Triticum urartu]